MTLLKSIAAIYFGLYLILPSCFCQVLTSFGVDVKHQHYGSVVESPLSATGEISGVNPICHCDDHCSKTATISPLTDDGFCLKFTNEEVSTESPKHAETAQCFAVTTRGPPDGPRWILAPFSGVFLL